MKISVYMMKFLICFFASVAVEFGQKDDKQICSEEAHSAHKKENIGSYIQRQAGFITGGTDESGEHECRFLGHEAKEEEKTSGLNCPENSSKPVPDTQKIIINCRWIR